MDGLCWALAVFLAPTRSSSTARTHPPPPSCPLLPSSSPTPSPQHVENELPLSHSFEHFGHPGPPHKRKSVSVKAALPHLKQVDAAPPSLHLAQVRHRPGRPLEANFLSKPCFEPLRPLLAGGAPALQQRQQQQQAVARGSSSQAVASIAVEASRRPHTAPTHPTIPAAECAYLRGKPNCLPPPTLYSCDGMGSAQGDPHLYR